MKEIEISLEWNDFWNRYGKGEASLSYKNERTGKTIEEFYATKKQQEEYLLDPEGFVENCEKQRREGSKHTKKLQDSV